MINPRAQAVAAGGFWRLLGMEVEQADNGVAVVRLALRPELLQLYGVLHGGALATLVDGAIGVAVQTTLQQRERAATTDLHVSYDRPARAGVLRARAELPKRGRTLVFGRCDVRDEEERLIAHGSATYLIST